MSAPAVGAIGARTPSRTRLAARAVFTMRILLSVVMMTTGALIMLLVAIPTLFMARRLYAEGIGRWIGASILALWGVHYRICGDTVRPKGPLVYISNHTSTIDVFLLIALALPRTRFFLSGFLRKVVPIGIIGYLIRIFWTVPQAFPEKRTRIFQRAHRILKHSGDNVYLSPEGQRVTNGEIGHFNKGSFHLATSLGATIVPLYLAIPAETNPGRGYDAKPGTIDVWFLPPIDASQWKVEDVERNRDRVHDYFVRVHDAVRAGIAPTTIAMSEEAPRT